jgi:hypothetical protein
MLFIYIVILVLVAVYFKGYWMPQPARPVVKVSPPAPATAAAPTPKASSAPSQSVPPPPASVAPIAQPPVDLCRDETVSEPDFYLAWKASLPNDVSPFLKYPSLKSFKWKRRCTPIQLASARASQKGKGTVGIWLPDGKYTTKTVPKQGVPMAPSEYQRVFGCCKKDDYEAESRIFSSREAGVPQVGMW